MAETNINGSDSDSDNNNIKAKLKQYRELVLIIYGILIWQQYYYPIILTSVVTTGFALVWYFNCSLLTTISVLAIISCLCDYSVPIINNVVFDTQKWNSRKQSKFDKVCDELWKCWNTITSCCSEWQSLKLTKPKIYYSTILSVLVVLSWIGNVVNNLFLTYLFVQMIVLFPGLKHNRILDPYINLLSRKLTKRDEKKKT